VVANECEAAFSRLLGNKGASVEEIKDAALLTPGGFESSEVDQCKQYVEYLACIRLQNYSGLSQSAQQQALIEIHNSLKTEKPHPSAQ